MESNVRVFDALARIYGGSDAPELFGTVAFYQRPEGVLVSATVTGLPHSGFFAFHIHDGGICSGDHFHDTGGHFDPTGQPHPGHAGDLPPLLSCGGTAKMSVLTDRFQLREVLGRTVVIHSDPDDFRSQPAGNSGTRIGCGMIRPL